MVSQGFVAGCGLKDNKGIECLPMSPPSLCLPPSHIWDHHTKRVQSYGSCRPSMKCHWQGPCRGRRASNKPEET